MVGEVFGAAVPLSAFEQYGGRAEHPESHPNGVHVKFDNGWVVSIQWGPGNYCDNHALLTHLLSRDAWGSPAPNSGTAEVACWKGEHADLVEFVASGDCVVGYRSWTEVQELLRAASKDELTDPITLWDLGEDDE